jgi:hypothetical protein
MARKASGSADATVAALNARLFLTAVSRRRTGTGTGPLGPAEVARHKLSTPGNLRIDLAHNHGHPQHPDGTPTQPRIRSATEAEPASPHRDRAGAADQVVPEGLCGAPVPRRRLNAEPGDGRASGAALIDIWQDSTTN